MTIEIRQIDFNNSNDLETAFPIMQQLRSHLTYDKFCGLLIQMAKEDYKLWAAIENNFMIGLVSSRLYTDLVRGPHIYVDDLVISEKARSRGVGAKLLNHLEQLSLNEGQGLLRLCCGLENNGGLKFYRKEGWNERAIALVKKLKP